MFTVTEPCNTMLRVMQSPAPRHTRADKGQTFTMFRNDIKRLCSSSSSSCRPRSRPHHCSRFLAQPTLGLVSAAAAAAAASCPVLLRKGRTQALRPPNLLRHRRHHHRRPAGTQTPVRRATATSHRRCHRHRRAHCEILVRSTVSASAAVAAFVAAALVLVIGAGAAAAAARAAVAGVSSHYPLFVPSWLPLALSCGGFSRRDAAEAVRRS